MSTLSKGYIPKTTENKWYSFWKKGSFFKADPHSSKPPFCIIMPPPNVTGILHMGHALVTTLQDILIRFKRMQGYEALWVPGTDHAGIATQTVIEKHLLRTTGKRRSDFSREEFLSIAWKWKEEKEKNIIRQLEKMGTSCDWSKLRFTMDEQSNFAVRKCFNKMYNENLIYRGDYLVNWDPVSKTALADDEVEYEEKESYLWYLRYPLADTKGYIIVATTRPETMLGDTAVAVSKKDPRFFSLVGKQVLLPFVNRKIPIIEDPLVDPKFGSGAVKVTPAHDRYDYDMALRQGLEFINIMTEDGKINENGGPFCGLSMKKTREEILAKMKGLDLIEKIEPYKVTLGVSYRSKAIIEPYLSKQWFIKMTPFKDMLLEVVQKKRIELIPSHWENTYIYWIENLRDWCISRQLWWGHRIPVWYNKDNPDIQICFDKQGIPPEVEDNPHLWYQDEDVLDTWFSSALWPISTLGWPKKTDLLKKFYPTSILITGHEIIFFWVARMIMMGMYIQKDVPFYKTFLHGLIYSKSYWKVEKDGSITYLPPAEKTKYDMGKELPSSIFSKWEKMSKSKGNVIDPLEIIDSYGSDAMRMALTSSTTHSKQIDLDRRRLEEFKNFANKIWNAARFIFQNLDGKNSPPFTDEELSSGLNEKMFTLEDRWILSRLSRLIIKMNNYLETCEFDKAAHVSYDFFWNKFCAYYLEAVKPALWDKNDEKLKENKQKLLIILLSNLIRLLHPIIPFITEEIFSLLKERLKGAKGEIGMDPFTLQTIQALQAPACIISTFPTLPDEKYIDLKVEKEFEKLTDIIHAIRNIRGEMQIPISQKTDLYILSPLKELEWIKENLPLIKSLVKLENVYPTYKQSELPRLGSITTIDNIQLSIPFTGDLLEKEKLRLEKEKQKQIKLSTSLEEKIKNEQFITHAPKDVREKIKNSLEDSQKKLKEIDNKLKGLF